MKKKNFLLPVLCAMLGAYILNGCGSENEQISDQSAAAVSSSAARESVSTSAESKGASGIGTISESTSGSADNIITETSYCEWKEDQLIAAAFLGGGNSWPDVRDGADAVSACQRIPEIADIGNVAISTGGTEFYVIFPRYSGQKFAIYKAEINPDTGDYSTKELLKEFVSNGKPFAIQCNVSDLYADVMIHTQDPADPEKAVSYTPQMSLRDGHMLSAEGVRNLELLAIDQEYVAEALDTCIGWGGDAGSSLKSVSAAVQMLQLAADEHAADRIDDAIGEAFAAWLNTKDSSASDTFWENWTGICDNVSSILDKDNSMQALLSDAGCLEQCREILTYDNVTENWEALKQQIDRQSDSTAGIISSS